ncbi:MAG: PD-(D/E)XK nuclease family transposase [Chlorobium sp.]
MIVNKDGIIRSTDALNILKMAVKLSSTPVSEWIFTTENATESAPMDRSNVDWSHVIPTVTLDHDVALDKWCYLLRHLPELTDRPQRLQEKVFSKVFEIAEIAKYSPAEAVAYEDSLKIYRDLKNVIDTAFDEGKAEGIEEGKLQVARRLVEIGMSVKQASEIAGVPITLHQSS